MARLKRPNGVTNKHPCVGLAGGIRDGAIETLTLVELKFSVRGLPAGFAMARLKRHSKSYNMIFLTRLAGGIRDGAIETLKEYTAGHHEKQQGGLPAGFAMARLKRFPPIKS